MEREIGPDAYKQVAINLPRFMPKVVEGKGRPNTSLLFDSRFLAEELHLSYAQAEVLQDQMWIEMKNNNIEKHRLVATWKDPLAHGSIIIKILKTKTDKSLILANTIRKPR